MARRVIVALGICIFLPGLTQAANLPISAPDISPADKTPTAAPATVPATATAGTPAAPSDSSSSTADASPPVTTPNAVAPHIRQPMAFADFAADYHPEQLHPDWLTVQVGTLETVFSPPEGKTMFVLPELPTELAAIYHPVEISCLLGAKSRYDNLTQFDVDPNGHPLGYPVPLGKVVYVLARAELSQGINFSFHYYESSELHWLPESGKDGWFMPITQAIVVTQDLLVPADSYVFTYLSNRVGPPHPNSTAQPVQLFTYLILHVHPMPQPTADSATPAPANGSP